MARLAVTVLGVAVLGVTGLAVAVLGVRAGAARLAEPVLGQRSTSTGLAEAVRAEPCLSAVVLGVLVPSVAGTIEPERRVAPGRLIARDRIGLTLLAVSQRLAMAGLAVIVLRRGSGLLRISPARVAAGRLTAEPACPEAMPAGHPLAITLLIVIELAVASLAVALVRLGSLAVAIPAEILLLAVSLMVVGAGPARPVCLGRGEAAEYAGSSGV